MTPEYEQIQAVLDEAKASLEKIEAAEAAGDYDAADAERKAADERLLEVTHLGPDEYGNTYTELVFALGGPNVWAIRGPHDTYFEVYCSWTGSRVSCMDDWDYIGQLYSHIADSEGAK